jgi:6-phosphofructokinase 1
MTDTIVKNCEKWGLDAVVCLGGGGTQKNALRLAEKGLNVITLPKTIDNDVAETDVTFGFDSATAIATEAIDRLHSTATSHKRLMLVDIMGHNAGWLALSASLAGGADVCLIPEIPYRLDSVVEALRRRADSGRRFSLVSIAEGARPLKRIRSSQKISESPRADEPATNSSVIAPLLEKALGIDTRVTTLGHIQRGGIPTATDRILATQLGTTAVRLIRDRVFGVMVAVKGKEIVPVPLEKVAGRRKTVPLDHPLVETARLIGLCLGD